MLIKQLQIQMFTLVWVMFMKNHSAQLFYEITEYLFKNKNVYLWPT